MRKKFYKLYILLIMIMLIIQGSAGAAVFMPGENTGDHDVVLVAGLDDFYPVEYFDNKTGSYRGIMPDILSDISDKTGMNFKYISTGGKIRADLASEEKCHLFSAYIMGQNADYAKDSVVAFSYAVEGKPVEVGWAFSSIADKKVIEDFKAAVEVISSEEINGYIISATVSDSKTIHPFFIVLISMLIIALLFFICLKLKKSGAFFVASEATDTETGIGNLTYFESNFRKCLSSLPSEGMYIAYIIIDINQLRFYHGEDMFADTVRYTARVLKSNSRLHEFAARITDNGFAFACRENSEKAAMAYIGNIIDSLNLYTRSEERNSKPVVHCAMCNLNSPESSMEVILFNLRKNCNKIIGTDTDLVFCDDYAMNRAAEEQKIVEDILNGFENEEFKLYMQFIVDNKTKKFVSAEALSRWEKPGDGVLSPAAYIKKMENVGLISTLDYYMFDKACMQLHKWSGSEFENLSVSCNFTRLTISETSFVDRIKEISSKYIFDRSKLIIEITEDVMEKNREMAAENILECKKIGFSVALDDMGSGYTSLRNLCEYPIDIVKIDREILLNAEEQKGKDLLEGIIALAHSLRLRVVCEGVETEEQVSLLNSTECDLIQGWYFSKPVPSEQCEDFIRSRGYTVETE